MNASIELQSMERDLISQQRSNLSSSISLQSNKEVILDNTGSKIAQSSSSATTSWLDTWSSISNSVIDKTASLAGILGDIGVGISLSGPGALIAKLYRSNFDPATEEIKTDKIPIICVHGLGYNEIQWVALRHFFESNEQCGSVFTLNLDGILTNQPENGIEDYAEKLAQKIDKICEQMNGMREFNLIGHSMGGLVCAYFAEHLASRHNVTVQKVITLHTPWSKPPLLETAGKLLPSRFKNPKACSQMSNQDKFLDHLKEQIASHKINTRYYSLYSLDDRLIPGEIGQLPGSTSCMFRGQGHYTPMLSPPVFEQIKEWILE